MEENELSQMTSWHLGTGSNLLCAWVTVPRNAAGFGTQLLGPDGPVREASLKPCLRPPAQCQLGRREKRDGRSLGNLHGHLPGSSPQYRKPSVTNTLNNDPAPRKNHRRMISLMEEHFFRPVTPNYRHAIK